MHVCHGSLCDICRNRMLEFVLRDPDEITSSSHRTTAQMIIIQGLQREHSQHTTPNIDAKTQKLRDAGEKMKMLQLLADGGSSRSVKEQLHSRLLSGTLMQSNGSKASVPAAHSSRASKLREPAPRSHFSDSSDDEMVDDTEECSGDSRQGNTKERATTNRGYKSTRSSEPYQSRAQKKYDQEVFDLEI